MDNNKVIFYLNQDAFKNVYLRKLDAAASCFSQKKYDNDIFWSAFFKLKPVVKMMFSKRELTYKLIDIKNKESFFKEQFAIYSESKILRKYDENKLILGAMYYFGLGTEPNAKMARHYLSIASKKGSGMAAFLLAFCQKKKIDFSDTIFLAANLSKRSMGDIFLACERGFNKAYLIAGTIHGRGLNGYEVDNKEALKYSEPFAKSGDPVGMFLHGYNLMRIASTNKEREEAFYWVERAYNEGYTYSAHKLATFYQYGFGCKKDTYKAVEFLQQNIERNMNGDPVKYEIKNRLPLHFAYLDTNQLELMQENDKRLFEIVIQQKEKHKDIYSVNLELTLAACYRYGIGTEKNLKKAIKVYSSLIKYDKGAVLRLASLLLSRTEELFNEDEIKNRDEIARLNVRLEKVLQRGVKNKSITCLYELAKLYYYATPGITPNTEKAIRLWNEAASRNHPYSCYELGRHYFERNKFTKYKERNKTFYDEMNTSRGYLEKALSLGCREAKPTLLSLETMLDRNANKEINYLFQVLNNNNDDVLLINEIIEDELTDKLNRDITSLDDNVRVSLVTSSYIFYSLNEMRANQINVDFAPVISLLSKALENTIKSTFVVPFYNYVKNNNVPETDFNIKNPIFDKNAARLGKKKFVKPDKLLFTLGDFGYLCERTTDCIMNSTESDLIDKDINNGFFDSNTAEGTIYWFFNKHFIDFCQKNIYKTEGMEARELVMKRIDDIYRLVAGFKWARNVTTHSKIGTFYDASSSYNLIIEKEKLLSLVMSKKLK